MDFASLKETERGNMEHKVHFDAFCNDLICNNYFLL